MTLTINLTPESQARLQHQAQAAGLPLETFLDRYVNEQLPQTPDATLPEPMPLEEWEMLLRSGTVSAPPIPPEALRRESLYGDAARSVPFPPVDGWIDMHS